MISVLGRVFLVLFVEEQVDTGYPSCPSSLCGQLSIPCPSQPSVPHITYSEMVTCRLTTALWAVAHCPAISPLSVCGASTVFPRRQCSLATLSGQSLGCISAWFLLDPPLPVATEACGTHCCPCLPGTCQCPFLQVIPRALLPTMRALGH